MTRTKPTMLILTFTEVTNDARVKKQAFLFAEHFAVVTCGYGPALRDDIEHIELDPHVHGYRVYLEPASVRAHLYDVAFRVDARSHAAREKVRGRTFDVVLANELETMRLAYTIVPPRRVLLDLHEYYPGLRDDLSVWVNVRKPYQEWLLRRQATRAGAVTTVSDTIAHRYASQFGLTCGVVRNAAPYQPTFAPGPATEPLRLVHSGVAAENRRPDVMMRAVARARIPVTLDLFLTQQHTPYGQELQRLANELGDRVHLHSPVPQAELVSTLNAYDVGVHILPPTTTNNQLALPNKFFDFVQARLGMLIGPTEDMATLLNRYNLGTVTQGFDEDAVVEAIESLTAQQVTVWKQSAHKHAEILSAEQQESGWVEAVESLLDRAL